jgi:hypothetical protein
MGAVYIAPVLVGFLYGVNRRMAVDLIAYIQLLQGCVHLLFFLHPLSPFKLHRIAGRNQFVDYSTISHIWLLCIIAAAFPFPGRNRRHPEKLQVNPAC